jgi:O-antigen/teichoic acid export membrane protein
VIKRSAIFSDFTKNVLVVFTGTTIAQSLPLAISPILTRLYTPVDFGVFALFFSITNLLGSIATLRYELAIVLPETEKEATAVETLCYVVTVGLSALMLVSVALFSRVIAIDLLGNPEIENWLFLAPLSVLFTGFFQTYTYRLNRKREFKDISVLKVTQTSTTAAFSFLFGLSNFLRGGLIFGHLLGQGAPVFFKVIRKIDFTVGIDSLKEAAKRFKKFPLLNAPSTLLNTAASSLPIFYLSKVLNNKELGFYGLVERCLGAPTSLISYSISQVLLQDIASRYRLGLPIRDRISKTLRYLMLIGIFPFVILFFFSDTIFAFVFGEEWREAGQFASILAVPFFVRFVISPLSVILISTHNLGLLMLWQLLYFVSTLLVVALQFQNGDVKQFLVLYALNDTLMYLIYLGIIYFAIRKH